MGDREQEERARVHWSIPPPPSAPHRAGAVATPPVRKVDEGPGFRLWLPRAVAFLLVLGTAAPSIVAGQGIEEPRVPLRTALMELNTLRTEYAEAFNRKDMAALGGVYAADAIFIGTDGIRLEGSQAIQEYMDGRTHPPTRPSTETQPVQTPSLTESAGKIQFL